jgi:hypothetical protein
MALVRDAQLRRRIILLSVFREWRGRPCLDWLASVWRVREATPSVVE